MVVSPFRARVRLPPTARRYLRTLAPHLPPLNFITVHYIYFIGTCLFSSIVFWGSSNPPRSISYVDSLFLTVSAMTLAGLNTVNLSQMNTFQQFILFALIMLGSAIFVSSAVVYVRRKAFERRFQSVVEEEQRRRKERRGSGGLLRRMTFSQSKSRPKLEVDGIVVRGSVIREKDSSIDSAENGSAENPGSQPPLERAKRPTIDTTMEPEHKGEPSKHETIAEPDIADHPGVTIDETEGLGRVRFESPTSPLRARSHTRLFSMEGVGARPDIINHPRGSVRPTYPTPVSAIIEGLPDGSRRTHKYFASAGLIGRNSQFHNLTLAERERLGGVEYRATILLTFIVPAYFILWQLLGCLGLGAYIANNRASTAYENGLNPWWVGAFNAVSAFNNSGMSLLDANMVAFQTSTYMLITMSLLILAGNTCYPVFLRFILWSMLELMPENEFFHEYRRTIRFLLDHPRRCYTTLFPSSHTWWLLATLVMLNGIDWAAFEVLNLGNSVITSIPRGARVLDGLFQAFAVRSGGFYVVPIANLRIGTLILYVLMMYISVYPVAITMRNSNVYEERSLGLYADDPLEKAQEAQGNFFGKLKRRMTNGPTPKEGRGYFVRQQLRGQLAHDSWWIALAVLFISITETGSFENDPVDYSVFNVLFEVVSGYGCVGISVGLPNVAYSFCGGWHTLSKLILCAVMIRGRHRGLPVAIDRAVLLPGEKLADAEEEDAQIRLEKSVTKGHVV